ETCDGSLFIVEHDSQGRLGFEAPAGQRPKWTFFSDGRLDDAERSIGFDECKSRGPTERIIEGPDLDPGARAWRELQKKPAMAPNLDIAKRIEMRVDRSLQPRRSLERDLAWLRPRVDAQRRRTLSVKLVDQDVRLLSELPA